MKGYKPRKVYTIDIGKMSKEQAEEYVRNVKQKMKKIDNKPIEPKWRYKDGMQRKHTTI